MRHLALQGSHMQGAGRVLTVLAGVEGLENVGVGTDGRGESRESRAEEDEGGGKLHCRFVCFVAVWCGKSMCDYVCSGSSGVVLLFFRLGIYISLVLCLDSNCQLPDTVVLHLNQPRGAGVGRKDPLIY